MLRRSCQPIDGQDLVELPNVPKQCESPLVLSRGGCFPNPTHGCETTPALPVGWSRGDGDSVSSRSQSPITRPPLVSVAHCHDRSELDFEAVSLSHPASALPLLCLEHSGLVLAGPQRCCLSKGAASQRSRNSLTGGPSSDRVCAKPAQTVGPAIWFSPHLLHRITRTSSAHCPEWPPSSNP